MTPRAQDLLAQVLQLSPDDRAEVAAELIDSLQVSTEMIRITSRDLVAPQSVPLIHWNHVEELQEVGDLHGFRCELEPQQ